MFCWDIAKVYPCLGGCFSGYLGGCLGSCLEGCLVRCLGYCLGGCLAGYSGSCLCACLGDCLGSCLGYDWLKEVVGIIIRSYQKWRLHKFMLVFSVFSWSWRLEQSSQFRCFCGKWFFLNTSVLHYSSYIT